MAKKSASKKEKVPKAARDVARKASKSQENLDPEEALASLEKRKSEAAVLAEQRKSVAELRWATAILRKPSAMISKEQVHTEMIQAETKTLEPKPSPSAHYEVKKDPSKGSKVQIRTSATHVAKGKSVKDEDEDDDDDEDEEEEQDRREDRERKRRKEKKVHKTRMEIMLEKEVAKEEKAKKEKEAKLQAALAEARGDVREEPDEKAKKGKKPKKEKKEKKPKKEKEEKKTTKIDKKDDKKGPEEIDWKHRLDELKKIVKEMGIDDSSKSKTRLAEGPKKKLSKKEKARLTAEAAEKQKLEAEAQARRLEELIRKKKEEERLAAIEQDKREILEQGWRIEQLEHTKVLMQEVVEFNKEVVNEETDLLEWDKYVACGKLPNSKMCDQMNTYLHLWEKEMECTSVQKASDRTRDVIQLLGELDELIDTDDGENPKKLQNWKWVRSLFRYNQIASLDVATYRLLRDVEHNLNRINIPTADFNFKDHYVTLCIWLRVMLPIPLPNPRRPPKSRIDISFDLMETSVLFPISIDCENAAIRMMYVKYDHLSDLSDTFNLPDVPKEYNMDLMETSKKEWCRKLKYKYDNRDKIKETAVKENPEGSEIVDSMSMHSEGQKSARENNGENTEKSEGKSIKSDLDVTSDTEDIPIVPYKLLKPSASEHAISKEDTLYTDTRSRLKFELDENVINLRKYTILGGVYHLNYLAQPPQPQDFITMDMTITSLCLPKQLEAVPFSVTYTPPPVEDPNIRKLPEEIEEDMKKQEEELDRLISINIKWPQHVIFLELPIVCKWNQEAKQWSKGEIFDLKHNEEKCTLSFRSGVFGSFGLATYRYANLPFQAYDIKPEADNSVTIQLTAAILMLEFNIKDGLICITQLQNSPNMALQDIVGQYFKIHRLRRMMKDTGIDIFPSFDSFCYVEGSSEKQWAMESHLYDNMALMANCFNFAWSRWNLQSGRRKIVVQMRDYMPTKAKQKNHQMLLVTPVKASFIDCTEVSPIFSEKEVESTKFCGDLYHLMKNTSGIFIRNKVSKACKKNVNTLAQFLRSTRILSFS